MAALASVGSAMVLVSLKIFLSHGDGQPRRALRGPAFEPRSDRRDHHLSLGARFRPAGRRRPHLRPRQGREFLGVRRDRPAAAHRRVHHLGSGAAAVFPRGDDSAEPAGDRRFWASRWESICCVRERSARVAREHASEALEADALHFSTDVWSTLVVIARHRDGVAGPAHGADLAALCRSAGRAGRGRRGHLGGGAAWPAHGRRPAGHGARGLAGARGAGRGGARRRASHRTRARAPRRQSPFRGRHDQRSADGELRAGARDQRCRRAPRRRDHSRRRDGAHGAASAGGRAPV